MAWVELTWPLLLVLSKDSSEVKLESISIAESSAMKGDEGNSSEEPSFNRGEVCAAGFESGTSRLEAVAVLAEAEPEFVAHAISCTSAFICETGNESDFTADVEGDSDTISGEK